jgi:hypothetical protein
MDLYFQLKHNFKAIWQKGNNYEDEHEKISRSTFSSSNDGSYGRM